ncbi:MAG TPA: hypothetical protein VEF90_05035 [Xanthobacteraceae bacterium]|nr:hypothetical protein [Xanthobacteraceae bacterium]
MRVLLLISILTLGACAREMKLPTAWARADGRPISSGLLDIDSLDCKDEAQKTDGVTGGNAEKGGKSQAMVDNFVSCMRERGYVQIKH